MVPFKYRGAHVQHRPELRTGQIKSPIQTIARVHVLRINWDFEFDDSIHFFTFDLKSGQGHVLDSQILKLNFS